MAQARLRDHLRDMVTRLLVGDGRQSDRSVHMALDADLLPGAELSVYAQEGAWVAHFTCSRESSFLALAAAAEDMARRMAGALGRACVWRIEAEGLPPGGGWSRVPLLLGDGVTAQARALPTGLDVIGPGTEEAA